MKITDLTVTLFAWPGIPATTYGRHTGRFSGESDLGLVTLRTDDGPEGHAFLGSAMRPASLDAQGLIQYLKPIVMGQDPLERERLWQALWQRNRATTIRTIGAVDVALWDLCGKIAGLPVHRLLGSYRHRVPAYASSAVLAVPQEYAETRRPGSRRRDGRPTRSIRRPIPSSTSKSAARCAAPWATGSR